MRALATMIFFVLATMIAQQAVAQQSCPSLVVSNNNDLVNGDISSPCALIANPGPNGISLRAALFAANNATGPGIITITFAQALAGQTISTTGGLGNPNLSRDGIAIIGLVDGNGQPTVTIDASSMGSNGILLPVVASNFTLQSLRFTGIEQSTSGPAFGVFIRAGELFGSPGNQQISGITISGNRFANTSSSSTGGNFISLGMESGSNGATVSDVSITGNTFSNFQGDADGILVGVGGTNNIVENVVIAGNTFSNITFPVELCACDATNSSINHTRIIANSFDGSEQAINLNHIGANAQTTANGNDDTLIAENTFTNSSHPSIVLLGGMTNASQNSITNTQIVNNLMTTGNVGVSLVGGRSGGTQNAIQGVFIVNDTIANNFSGNGIDVNANLGGTGNTISGVAISNAILWANSNGFDFFGVTPAQVQYSISAQLGFAGVNNNINADPLFVNAAGGDFHLQSGSPALHAGITAGSPAIDLDCQPRGSPPSIGAYEFDGPNICSSTYSAPLTATPTSGTPPLVVNFMASGLSLPMTYTVSFGDGTTGALAQSSCIGVTAIVSGQGGIQCSGSASHTYTAAGSYTATLLNALGLTVGTLEIFVTGAAPNVSIALPHKATIVGSQVIPAMQDGPRQIVEASFAGGNATVPTISSFTASPASIAPFAGGGSATLSWSVASATSLSISGLGTVTGNSIQVSPTQTTTYTLTASSAQGAVTAQTTVIVAGYRSRQDVPLR